MKLIAKYLTNSCGHVKKVVYTGALQERYAKALSASASYYDWKFESCGNKYYYRAAELLRYVRSGDISIAEFKRRDPSLLREFVRTLVAV